MKRLMSLLCCLGFISILFAACNTENFPIGHGGNDGNEPQGGIDSTYKSPTPVEVITSIDDLPNPTEARNFINTYFPGYYLSALYFSNTSLAKA